MLRIGAWVSCDKATGRVEDIDSFRQRVLVRFADGTCAWMNRRFLIVFPELFPLAA